MRIGDLGGFEWLVILVIVLLVFGTGKLAQIGPALGKSIRGFKQELHADDKKTGATAESTESSSASAVAASGTVSAAASSDDGKGGWF